MSDPPEEGAAARKALVECPFVDEEASKRRQYVVANRDRTREMNRLWRADPERTKLITRQRAERNKERCAELQRNRRSDPEIYQSELEANAAARRLNRSLSRSGLPPKLLHATTAAEPRTNEREADAYFNDLSRPEHLRQSTVFAESLTEHMLKNGAACASSPTHTYHHGRALGYCRFQRRTSSTPAPSR